jgi:hypothetical protein
MRLAKKLDWKGLNFLITKPLVFESQSLTRHIRLTYVLFSDPKISVRVGSLNQEKCLGFFNFLFLKASAYFNLIKTKLLFFKAIHGYNIILLPESKTYDFSS